ncbi:Hsp70 nucleotide exchange factor FES1 [Striga asiatica]|uniref:Hsp70 nucleotide exchange factor FES1 n=1 Tax=Striga asiatica TaxID=4170 RepID=A0A5A7RJ52_STRAF|nr:Hsp70 nucleotide exchange factor FES1 [Striga asiatica]
MVKEGPNWDGLLKWSLSHSDGTNTSRTLSEEDRRWFMEAVQAQSVDIIGRMKEITLVMQAPEHVLESQGVTPQDIEGLLDELQEHVESIDMANDLKSIGGLEPLINHLKNSHSNIRAKAAEVVSTIVQNNPTSQKSVMDSNGLEPLLSNFIADPDVLVRTKALGAISSLIRHNKPGISAFRLANGYAALRDALGSESVRFQRKALNLIHYLLQENHLDRAIATELGFSRIFMHLASSQDIEVREGALSGLLELARAESSRPNNISCDENEKLKEILQERIRGISEMSIDDLGAAKEERHLVDSLWKTCFNEPSSLGEMGLLYLPGEDGPPPDVVGQLFQQPLRAWAANRDPNGNSSGGENKPVLLLGLGPSSGT